MKVAVTTTILLEVPDQPIGLLALSLRRSNEAMVGRPMQTVSGQIVTILALESFDIVERSVALGFTCPHCGRTSYNRHDAAQRYCGACHRFVDS